MLVLPYGISDFYQIRTQHYRYLDRTHYLPILEQAGKQLVFLRPRRFGKSLLISMLEHYYDLNKAEQFALLFGDLNIGQHPTTEHNQYLILRWDFSMVSAIGDIEHIKHSLFTHINLAIKDFARQYQNLLQGQIDIIPDALGSFQSLVDIVSASHQQLYLLIDEYDNFANEVLISAVQGEQRYRDLLSGEGIVKTLFKIIKGSASEGKIARVFITGVSPIVLADMTSGYNVAVNIALHEELNSLCGITEVELIELLTEVVDGCQSNGSVSYLLDTMRQFYNGYRFCHDLKEPTVYNPTLCFYFLNYYQRRCETPLQLLDGNLAMDASRIRYIANLPLGHQVISQILDEQNPPTLTFLENQFGVEHLHKLQQLPSYMLSLMYYFGVLTIVGQGELEDIVLGVPNRVIYRLYVEELKEQLLPLGDQPHITQLARQFYQTAHLSPLADALEAKYFAVFDNRDYRWSNELTIKTAFMTLLFNDAYYIMDSEASVQRRYTDLVMIIRPSMRKHQTLKDFVLEFKYLKLGDLGLNAEAVRAQSREELLQLPLVQEHLKHALDQLGAYRTTLNNRYQQPERLYCIAIIALGFERLVWQVL
ncbi:MAG: AAA family ATPase [Thiofilum sp.]|uniref:AAA family ATPase n=1 Tax=Thiofilum sp. TaxID=2212733 RepID=UPI0025D71FB8|nr:AAA family ATPase [Thiofilum sp.]MBK8452605.1 AAA family ATPase [Thiofilum sp.]